MSKAFMFAGQGAQKVGMASETVSDERVRRMFDVAESIRPGIVELMLSGSQQELDNTLNTQPAMFIADLAYAYTLETQIGRPSAVCGFSVGEIPALVYAGALDERDGFKLIALRAELMSKACAEHGGKMIAVIGLPPKEVEQLALSLPECWAVNYNAPSQTVVAASMESAEEFTTKAKEKGAKCIPLRVSGAFHCPYMEEAGKGLKAFLESVKFSKPEIPVYSNLTALPYSEDEQKRKELLAKQVCSPVLFTETVKNMKESGISEFYEVGPGKVLTGLLAKMQ